MATHISHDDMMAWADAAAAEAAGGAAAGMSAVGAGAGAAGDVLEFEQPSRLLSSDFAPPAMRDCGGGLLDDDEEVYRSMAAAPHGSGLMADDGGLLSDDDDAFDLPLRSAAGLKPGQGGSYSIKPVPVPYFFAASTWKVAGVSDVELVEGIQAALGAAGMQASEPNADAHLDCAAATDGGEIVRFKVRLYRAKAALIEFEKRSGSSLGWDKVFRTLRAEMPAEWAPVATTTIVPGLAALQLPSLTRADEGVSATPQYAAKAAMRASMSAPELATPVLAAGDAAPILAMAGSGLVSNQLEAAQHLASLSAEPKNAAALVSDSAVPVLVNLIQSSANWQIFTAAVAALANTIAGVATNGALLAAAVGGATPTLKQLVAEVRERKSSPLTSDPLVKQQLRRECSRALAAVSLDTNVAKQLSKQHLEAALYQGTTCTDELERKAAQQCLTNIVAATTALC